MQTDILSRISVIIPSLDPDEKLKRTVNALLEAGFSDLILVNDGSRSECLQNFPLPDAKITLLTHEVNRGKGAALKTAFRYIMENRKDSFGAVTVDGDGQHDATDVLNCVQAMAQSKDSVILGCRDFSLPHVPRRSRYGNRITSFVFKIFCGLKISDTQTGLRAFPAYLYPTMLEVDGERFEYETNMLLEMQARGISYREIPIRTVYIEENITSHFRPFVDSVKIYSLILKFVASSFASFVLDIVLFYAFLELFSRAFCVDLEDEVTGAAVIAAAKGIARILSSFANFLLNREKVFRSKEQVSKTILRYYALAIPILLVSAGATALFKDILSIGSPMLITLIGIAVDFVLFVISFRLQQAWVFGRRKANDEK